MPEPIVEQADFPPIEIDAPTLRARKARLNLRSEDLVERGVASWRTVTAFFAGEPLNLTTIQRLAAQLGLQVEVRFKEIEQQ